jgi:hypothetical protein
MTIFVVCCRSSTDIVLVYKELLRRESVSPELRYC